MAPTRMKLRVRRRDDAAGGAAVQPEEEELSRPSGRSSRRKNTSASSSAAAASSSSPPSSSSAVASASARAVMAAEEASPDSKCPICLDRFNNLAYLDRCLHRFCFPCIQEWSHNKAECPLCKQPFASILHSVRAEDDFKEYTLRPPPANSSVAATVAMVAAMASAARSDHQMRLMLRRHRGGDSGETTSRRRRRERGGRGSAGRRAGVWEWYLDSPSVTLPPLPHAVSPVLAEDSEEGEEVEEHRVRPGADLSERGVIFEGLTGLGGTVAPIAPNDRESRRLMTRLAARQRLQREGGTVRRLRERETVAFRRALYRSAIRVRGVAGVNGNSNQGQQQHDITAESFRRNPTYLNRLRPWLRRELTVLYGAHGSLIDIVQRIIMARLARHGLEDTPTIEEELRPFLLARTDHFLHELVSFARSPLSLEHYDLQAVYEPPAAAMELDGISSSSTSSSVIAISEGEEGEGGAAPHDEVIRTGSCLSLSAWDDETPGPSYSTAEPSCSLAPLSFSPAPQEAAANEEAGEKAEEEECLIVGYKKPIAERTPELVQLSSNSEEEEEEEKTKEDPLPASTPPLSYLPTIPPSTSCAFRDEQDDKPRDGGEADGCRSRARSWSGSSGRSRKSVCSLSPGPPGDGCRDRKQCDGEAAREKRRRKRSRRAWERSGTLYNPNRSIYPAMMRRRSSSPSPFDSSADSGSLSPADSSWDRHQVSPLTSSVCSSSPPSSPLDSSPQPSSRTPPTPSLSPSDRSHHGEKPGGKRKYKSRHLDDDKDPTWRPSRGEGKERRRGRREKERRRRRGRRERRKKEAQRESGDSRRRCRDDRSPSVEIIYEGTVTSGGAQPPARKRRRKRPRNTANSSSPVIITLDSDSSHDDANNKRSSSSSSSSSPISSQQTVDFSDLPPLPLVHSAGVGGALSSEIGELPVDILDRESDGSETEPVGRTTATGPIAIDNSDNSDGEVDVENVDGSRSPLGLDADADDDDDGDGGKGPKGGAGREATIVGGGEPSPGTSDQVQDMNPEVSTSDSHLLATILNDLKGVTPPRADLPVRPDPNCSYSVRKKRWRDPCEARPKNLNCNSPAELRSNDFLDQTPGSELATLLPCVPVLPPLERLREFRVRGEARDAPPLLKQASPVRSYNRNAPPPLKHKDAGSPHLLPISSGDVHSPPASVSVSPRVGLQSNQVSSPVDSRQNAELPQDTQAIPPISTLRRPDLASSSSTEPSESQPTFTIGTHPRRPLQNPKPASECHPSSGSDLSPHLDFSYLHCSNLHSSFSSMKEDRSAARSPPADSHPVSSLSPVDFHSDKGVRCRESPALTDSTSRGVRNNTRSHPSCGASAGGPEMDGDVFSGANCHDASLPVFVPSTDSFSIDSLSSGKLESRSVGVSSLPLAASSGRLSHVQVRPGSPESTVDFHSCGAASGRLTNNRTASVSREEPSPPGRVLPVSLDPVSTANVHSSGFLSATINQHLNHSALLSRSDRTADSRVAANAAANPAAKHHNHFDPRRDARSTHNLSVDSGSKRDFHLSTDNHLSSSPQWNSSDSQSPIDVWNKHNHSAT